MHNVFIKAPEETDLSVHLEWSPSSVSEHSSTILSLTGLGAADKPALMRVYNLMQ